jgi:hypothetical protein
MLVVFPFCSFCFKVGIRRNVRNSVLLKKYFLGSLSPLNNPHLIRIMEVGL